MFDTAIAGSVPRGRALGLDVLLDTYLGVALPPSRQKGRLVRRPLTDAQTLYAAADVQHLFALRTRLSEELTKIGRLAWVEREMRRARRPAGARAPVDPDAYLGVRARELPPAGWRSCASCGICASAWRAPPTARPSRCWARMSCSAWPRRAPTEAATLGTLSGITPRVLERWGAAILGAVEQAQALPESALAHDPAAAAAGDSRRHEPPHRGALRRWRTGATRARRTRGRRCCPNRLHQRHRRGRARTLDELARVEGVRRWRVETLGTEHPRGAREAVRRCAPAS